MNIAQAISSAQEYQRAGNLEQAELLYREILHLQPDNIFILGSLGNVLRSKGHLDEAIRCYQKIIALDPKFAGSYNDIGNILRKKGLLDEAKAYYLKAIELAPKFEGSYYNLGQVFEDTGQLDKAIRYYQKTIELNPNLSGAYYNLGNVLVHQAQHDQAIHCYQKAIHLNPNFYEAYNALGNTFSEQEKLDKAVESFLNALEINPGFAEALCNLGNTLVHHGKLDYAESCYKRALIANHNLSPCYSNFLLSMLYNSRHSAQNVLSEHIKFAQRFEKPLLSSILPNTNDRTLNRKLKIGYVSPDFRRHSVAYFLEPVLAAHNRDRHEVFCYSLVSEEDEVTKKLQGCTDHWRNIAMISDEQAAELIRNDNIDVLVDLAGHTSNNRILLFARKSVPVQASWIGYPSTTGLSTIDYKIVDNYTDPPDTTDHLYTEKLIRMPESFSCYFPDGESPEVGSLPALISGQITFGSFNNFSKASPEVLELWTRILQRTHGSHLIMKSKVFLDDSTRDYVFDTFSKKGIAAERIELLSWEPSIRGHLDIYNQIDIALDTFPYNGTTTTCEALWMGVPVITLEGNTHASRVGFSLLSNIGLPEFAAKSAYGYVEIAVKLAKDLNRLQVLRERLRDMMAHSPLMDKNRFTINLENCYRTMWRKWCKSIQTNISG
jgi:protein O-GlcNAc transferase